jgi:hypothetical protein
MIPLSMAAMMTFDASTAATAHVERLSKDRIPPYVLAPDTKNVFLAAQRTVAMLMISGSTAICRELQRELSLNFSASICARNELMSTTAGRRLNLIQTMQTTSATLNATGSAGITGRTQIHFVPVRIMGLEY